jgi:hypothetical protein
VAGSASLNNATANVSITARLVSTDTGAILASVTGVGKASRKSVGAGGAGSGSGGGGFGVVDMKRSNFGDTIIGEATLAAVTDLTTKLEGKVAMVPVQALSIEGQVADASGGIVTLSVGAKHGVKSGMVFAITNIVREIRDPASDKVIRRIENTIGTVTITELGDDWAAGRLTGSQAASGGVKRGDAARLEKQ